MSDNRNGYCFDHPRPPRQAPEHSPVSPGYYQAPNGVSFHQIVDGWQLDHWDANAVKYVLRGKLKGNPIEDCEKAIWCLMHKLALLKAAQREEVQS